MFTIEQKEDREATMIYFVIIFRELEGQIQRREIWTTFAMCIHPLIKYNKKS